MSRMVLIYSITHFLIDFACAFLMFRYIAGAPDVYLCVLLYNFCAFAAQMPIGIIADKINRNSIVAITGCFLVGLAYTLTFSPITAVITAGIGNAMFHIGGGIDTLNISGEKLRPLGVFVAPGAFGIYYGAILGKGSGFKPLFFPLSLIAAAGIILTARESRKGYYPKNPVFSLEGVGSGHLIIAITCLFAVVCLRSYMGLTMDFPWKSVGYWGTALICAVVFGKALGGFIADKLGVFKTAAISLGCASLLFLLPQIPLAGVAAVLLFNMTMPITLWVMAKIMPEAKGFAFGLLTFGLFIGFLPVYLGIGVLGNTLWTFAVISVISLVILLVGLKKAKV